MVLRLSRGEPFLGCSAYPKCRNTVSLGPKRGKAQKAGASRRGGGKKFLQTDIPCEKCGKKMVVRMGRRGPFLACPGYPKCKNAKDATPELIEKFNAMDADGEKGNESAPADEKGAHARKPPANRPPTKKETNES